MADAPKRWSLPDVRGWATIGMFAMVAYVITLAALNPQLAENHLFSTLATLICGTGGFGLVCAFLWGGSKASTHAAEAVSEIAKRQTGAEHH